MACPHPPRPRTAAALTRPIRSVALLGRRIRPAGPHEVPRTRGAGFLSSAHKKVLTLGRFAAFSQGSVLHRHNLDVLIEPLGHGLFFGQVFRQQRDGALVVELLCKHKERFVGRNLVIFKSEVCKAVLDDLVGGDAVPMAPPSDKARSLSDDRFSPESSKIRSSRSICRSVSPICCCSRWLTSG